MKKLFYVLLLIGGAAVAQEKLTYGTGGTAYGVENQRISPNRVRELMKDNPEALKLYNAGRRKKTLGNVLFYSGIWFAATDVFSAFYAGRSQNGFATAAAGGVLFVASFPVKMGYTKKVKQSFELYNQGVSSVQRQEFDMTVIANSNGVGFQIQF